MRYRIELEGYGLLSDELAVGDEIELGVKARVVAIEDDMVDVTPLGSEEPQYVMGERKARLLLLNIRTP